MVGAGCMVSAGKCPKGLLRSSWIPVFLDVGVLEPGAFKKVEDGGEARCDDNALMKGAKFIRE